MRSEINPRQMKGRHDFKGNLAVITPTRDRPYALSLLKKYIERQTAKPDLWIISSEGVPPEVETAIAMVNVHDGAPRLAGKYSLCRNMIRAIGAARQHGIDGVLIMEDDDWYREDYIERASHLLNEAWITGIYPVQYLHLTNGNFRLSNAIPFSQMGFTSDVFQDVIDIANRGVELIDQHLQKLPVRKKWLHTESIYTLSLKGMYGSQGVTSYHNGKVCFGKKCDDIYETLKGFIGESDASAYRAIVEERTPLANNEQATCILFNLTGDGKHYGCDVVTSHLYKLLGDVGLTVSKAYRSGYIDHMSLREIRGLISGANLVVVNGEGSIHHDNVRAKALALIGMATKIEAIPSALINSTLYKNSRETMQRLAMFEYVSVRESSSRADFESTGSTCDVAPDLTFYKKLSAPLNSFHGRARVGDSINPQVTRKLRELATSRGWNQRSIMHPVGKGSAITYINTHADHGFVVTGRYHDVCFCLNAGIPFVAVESNTNKISSLLLDVFGTMRRLISPGEINSLNVEEFCEFSATEVQAIHDFMLVARNQYESMKENISQLIAI